MNSDKQSSAEQEKKTPGPEDTKKEAAAENKAEEKAAEKKPEPQAEGQSSGDKAAPEKPEASKSGKPEEKKPSPEELLAAEHDRYLRLLAEYDNYRKRSAKERDSIYSDVRADTVTKFLPVYDNLVRALEQSTEDAAYRRGVEMIMDQFNEVLGKMGVAPIEAVGAKFDPSLHNAVLHDQDPQKGEGEIVQELQRGFRMGDKVIRFSMVKTVN